MSLILSGVLTLLQHADQLRKDPESYRPLRCPCGHGRVWCHGSYTRKPCCCDPVEQGCSPVLILRFYCPDCRATCSVLPECLPPRSWYLWKVRQIILLSLLSGISMRSTVASYGSSPGTPCGSTIKRWWKRLKERFTEHSFSLRNHFPWLGRHTDFVGFWNTLLSEQTLACMMRLVHLDGITVP